MSHRWLNTRLWRVGYRKIGRLRVTVVISLSACHYWVEIKRTMASIILLPLSQLIRSKDGFSILFSSIRSSSFLKSRTSVATWKRTKRKAEKKNKQITLDENHYRTLYTLKSVFIFSILFSINFLARWLGEFVWRSTACLVNDHFP